MWMKKQAKTAQTTKTTTTTAFVTKRT